jgi:hypothetical protein
VLPRSLKTETEKHKKKEVMKIQCSSMVSRRVVCLLAGCLMALGQAANAQEGKPVRTIPGGVGGGTGMGGPAKAYQAAGNTNQVANTQRIGPVRTIPGGVGQGTGVGGPVKAVRR